ncbi:MAG: hypothetical protein FJZ58_06865, partial [Chlamydiae bacterium]|nr:hypothetical protein [Chlamydiota bacterium]
MSKWWILSLLICWEASGDSAKYWLLQQDFIKVGKRDLYEEVQQKQSKRPIRLGMEDLENAQYVFLEPLKTLGALAEYPPFAEDSLGLEARCLYFQIFSLLQLLPQFSNLEATFSASRPYYRYVVYEVSPAS